MEKIILTAAITGAETTREKNPALPLTPAEQAADAAACVAAGAAIIHLHVRDKEGRPSQDPGDFKRAIEAIRAACRPEPIIQLSTGGAAGDSPESRLEPIIRLKPEMASLNVGSMSFGEDVFINHPRDVAEMARHFQQAGVVPEVEVYDPSHIDIAKTLVKKGLINRPVHYQFVLGVPGGMGGDIRNLVFMRDSIDPRDSWGVAGIGRFELPLAVHAMMMGGRIRVGFEDNVYFARGVLAKSNAQLVKRIADIAAAAGLTLAAPQEARRMLGITG